MSHFVKINQTNTLGVTQLALNAMLWDTKRNTCYFYTFLKRWNLSWKLKFSLYMYMYNRIFQPSLVRSLCCRVNYLCRLVKSLCRLVRKISSQLVARKSYFYFVFMPLTAIYLSVLNLTSRHLYLTIRHCLTSQHNVDFSCVMSIYQIIMSTC